MAVAWLKKKKLAGDTVTDGIICEKVHTIHDDLS